MDTQQKLVGYLTVFLSADQREILDELTDYRYSQAFTYEKDTASRFAPSNPERYLNYVSDWFKAENLGELTDENLKKQLNTQRELIGGN
jgi:hypothetical protein